MAEGNAQLSYLLAEAIVRGLLRLSMDETKTIAQAIFHFLSIEDDLTRLRIEAVLGVPMLA